MIIISKLQKLYRLINPLSARVAFRQLFCISFFLIIVIVSHAVINIIVIITDLFGAKQRNDRDEISRDANQHEENTTGGGEVQQPPRITDEEDHRSWILQHLFDRHAVVVIAFSFVVRHPPVLQHLEESRARLWMPVIRAVSA